MKLFEVSQKFIFKQMLKFSAFYLEKQKSFIPKKTIFLAVVSKHAKIIPKMALAVLIFSEGFDQVAKYTIVDPRLN